VKLSTRVRTRKRTPLGPYRRPMPRAYSRPMPRALSAKRRWQGRAGRPEVRYLIRENPTMPSRYCLPTLTSPPPSSAREEKKGAADLFKSAGTQTQMISYLSMDINFQVRCEKEAI
jgi:hypothetical protein